MLIGNSFSWPIAAPASSQLRPCNAGGPSLSAEKRSFLFVGTSRADLHQRVVAALLVTFLLLLPSTASAHTETGAVGGLVSGFLHPLTGLDHVVAIVAVGLWGVSLGAPAVWLLPVIFPVVMALGGALGVLGVPLPGVETGIALPGGDPGFDGSLRRQTSAENCRRDRRSVCHFSRSCAWDRAARGGRCTDLCGGIRDRNRVAAPERNCPRSPGTLAMG